MHRLEEEDPTISNSRDPQTKDLLLSGQGQLHIEVTVAKLKRRFGVDVNLKPPRIPYRETIKASTEAHGRHKKQTGGHGQFGDCKIKVEPLPRGADFEFVDDIFGGSIPRQFIPAVEKGIQDARTRVPRRLPDGGFPRDGVRRHVPRRRLERALVQDGRLAAFKDAMTRARPTILEPIMNVEVYAPSDFAGDLMGDLNGRRGRIVGMDTRGETTIIKAQVPMAEMLTYESTGRPRPVGVVTTTWSTRITTRCRANCRPRSSRRRKAERGGRRSGEVLRMRVLRCSSCRLVVLSKYLFTIGEPTATFRVGRSALRRLRRLCEVAALPSVSPRDPRCRRRAAAADALADALAGFGSRPRSSSTAASALVAAD